MEQGHAGTGGADAATKDPVRVLVVDDEDTVRRAVVRLLNARGFEASEAEDGESALAHLQREPVDVLLADFFMPRMNGLELLMQVKDSGIDVVVVMMTGHAEIANAVSAVRSGAYNYLKKPFDTNEGVLAIEQAAEHKRLLSRNRALQAELASRADAHRIVGRAPAMRRLLTEVRTVAPLDVSVLILGENGTGKELVARELHSASLRAKHPFVAINCGAIPDHLVESELFGHKKGAFTGADRDRDGLFVKADRGTIFLDEVGDLPLHHQVKLLRVLQQRVLRPVGGDEDRAVDVRVLAATNRDLRQAVVDKVFREDLYFRLATILLRLPPLRERKGDVAGLAYQFLRQHAANTRRKPLSLDPDALHALEAYDWPGNVRELQSAIDRGVAFARDDVITLDVLPEDVRAAARKRLSFVLANGGSMANTGVFTMKYNDARRQVLEDFERAYIEAKLKECGNNIAQAAKAAGLDRANFKRVLHRTRDREERASDDDER